MKKIKALMFAFVLAGMTVVSCSSDDDGPAPTVDGRWNQEKAVVRINNQSITQQYDLNVNGCDKNYIEFASGAVFNEVVYFKTATGACDTDMIPAGSFIKSDNTLSISNGGDYAGTYTITRLSNSELQISTNTSEGGVAATTTLFFRKAN